jgi:hypothetical protein
MIYDPYAIVAANLFNQPPTKDATTTTPIVALVAA